MLIKEQNNEEGLFLITFMNRLGIPKALHKQIANCTVKYK